MQGVPFLHRKRFLNASYGLPYGRPCKLASLSGRLKQYRAKRPPGFAMEANQKALNGSSRVLPASLSPNEFAIHTVVLRHHITIIILDNFLGIIDVSPCPYVL
jgi:hypothetical protein